MPRGHSEHRVQAITRKARGCRAGAFGCSESAIRIPGLNRNSTPESKIFILSTDVRTRRASLEFFIHRASIRSIEISATRRSARSCIAMAVFVVTVATVAYSATGSIASGELKSGTINTTSSDTWTFTGQAGHAIFVLVGDAARLGGFSPRIQLLAPDTTVLGDQSAEG